MANINEGRPSKADNLPTKKATKTRKIQEAAMAAEEMISRAEKRGTQVYRNGNELVATHVDPLPGMLVAAAAGFFIGCLWAYGRST